MKLIPKAKSKEHSLSKIVLNFYFSIELFEAFISTNHIFIEKLATPWPRGWPSSEFSCWFFSGLLSGLPGRSLGGLLSRSYVRFSSWFLCRCPSGPTCRYHGRPSSSNWPMRRPMSGLGHWIHVWKNKTKVVYNWLY